MVTEFVHRGEPFNIRTSEGEKNEVPHTDFIAIGRDNDDTIVIYKKAGGLRIIDIFNIMSLDETTKSA